MNYYNLVAEHFQQSMEAISLSVDTLAEPLQAASQLLVNTFLQDHKLITCGTGLGCYSAQLMSCYLNDQYRHERPALPALFIGGDPASQGSIVENVGRDESLARQVRALGTPGDVLMVAECGTGSAALAKAITAAHERNLAVILLSSNVDSDPDASLQPGDIRLTSSCSSKEKVFELQIMTVGCLCELIDLSLFGELDGE